jgi:hypothetical protein
MKKLFNWKIAHGLLVYREKQSIHKKLNMVIGIFSAKQAKRCLRAFIKTQK